MAGCAPSTNCVRFEPCPHIFVFVVARVVLDVVDMTGVVGVGKTFQIGEIGLCVEDIRSVIEESCRVDLYAAKDLHGFPHPGDGHQRLMASARPRVVESRVLPEACLVLVDQRRSFLTSFLLSEGYV